MEFPYSVKYDSKQNFASTPDFDISHAGTLQPATSVSWQDSIFKATKGGGSSIGPHYYQRPNSSEYYKATGQKRVYETYNCQYCERAVSIERTKADFCIWTLIVFPDPDETHITTNAYPYHHWIYESDANKALIDGCTKFCFGGCFNSFVGKGLCTNNCNNSCTGATSTPTCNIYTGYKKISYTFCTAGCHGQVDCLQQCVDVVGTPCYWCFNDTTCNGCVFACTSNCANATDNLPENCYHQWTKGSSSRYTYCRTCDGMTGHCNTVCNNTTSCASCTTGCTAECTTGCYTSTVSGTCLKNCNTNCYGMCTESCTCDCTAHMYSGCGNSTYNDPWRAPW